MGWIKKHPIWTIIIIVIVLGIGAAGSSDTTNTTTGHIDTNPTATTQDASIASAEKTAVTATTATPTPTATIQKYEILEEQDVSYKGCKRASFKVLLPDNTTENDINSTLRAIVESKKSEWDDITIWAYKQSERDIAPNSAYTLGMQEYSVCE